MVIQGWIDEYAEDKILRSFGVEPGDLHRAVENAEWLLYSLGEICRMEGRLDLLREVSELKMRVRYGVRRELLSLTSIEGIGRVRARALYNAGYTDPDKLRSAPTQRIAEVHKIGPAVARKIREQLTGRVE